MLKTDFKFGEVYALAGQVAKNASKVDFKEVFSNDNGGVVLLAFCAGQELPTHQAPAEVMVCLLEGEVEFTMLDRRMHLGQGDFLLMGNGVDHSVRALKDSKIMLVKIKHD